MKLYSENEKYKLYEGSMLDMLEIIDKESIDSIITDPPYELNFMGKGWDNSGIAFQVDTWKKCYEVLKSGGYLLAFGGSRTFHRIAVAIEDAGFEIRDTIMWLYGSGFPKSLNIGLALDKKNGIQSKVVGEGRSGNTSKAFNDYQYRIDKGIFSTSGSYEIKQAQNEWKGWGTALKPSFEPIIVARKPFKGSLVDNVIEYGVGGINIDECRVGNEIIKGGTMPKMGAGDLGVCNYATVGAERIERQDNIGRFPANTILTYDETDFGEVCGGFPQNQKPAGNKKAVNYDNKDYDNSSYKINYTHNPKIAGDNGGSASRYFYCAKASKKDRDEGLDEFEEKNTMCDRNPELASANMPQNRSGNLRKNTHPTVKPCDLMQYLVRLVTPNGGTVLDPFNGSGSTGKAVMYENKERNKNYKYIGIELTEEYLPIAKARIEYVCKNDNSIDNLKETKEEVPEGQTNIFDFIGSD